jgi:hypothetical protein
MFSTRYAVFLAGLFSYGSVSAADLTVEVRHAERGDALAHVAVCLGTAADPSQFGAVRTDADGLAHFRNLLPSSQVVTVSSPGFRGVRRPVEPMDVNRVIQIGLASGGGGPECEAPAAGKSTAPANGLLVLEFRINGGSSYTNDREVVLDHRAVGDPTHYRVSESPQFKGAEWQPYVVAPRYGLSEGRGTKQLYFQLRRYRELGGASLQTESPVVTDRIRLR